METCQMTQSSISDDQDADIEGAYEEFKLCHEMREQWEKALFLLSMF